MQPITRGLSNIVCVREGIFTLIMLYCLNLVASCWTTCIRCTWMLEIRSAETTARLIITKQRWIWRIKPVSKSVEGGVSLFFNYSYTCQKIKWSGGITSTFLANKNNNANNNKNEHWNWKINSTALYCEVGENMKNTVKCSDTTKPQRHPMQDK